MITRIILYDLIAGVIVCSHARAEENPIYQLPPVTVQGTSENQERIGPYGQPPWSAHGRFSSTTLAYVLPPGFADLILDYQGTFSRHEEHTHLFTQELEIGLPHRFQVAVENNIETGGHPTQVTVQNIEARYAIADWGKIPFNPTVFVEYKYGVGHDNEAPPESNGEAPPIPNSFEVRLLFAEQLAKKFQYALNIFHERQTGGDQEWENGFSQALSLAIREEYLNAGIEMQLIRRTDVDTRSDPESEFDIGPNLSWKPGPRTKIDLAALFGTTHESPDATLFAVVSFSLGGGEKEAQGSEPVSTINR